MDKKEFIYKIQVLIDKLEHYTTVDELITPFSFDKLEKYLEKHFGDETDSRIKFGTSNALRYLKPVLNSSLFTHNEFLLDLKKGIFEIDDAFVFSGSFTLTECAILGKFNCLINLLICSLIIEMPYPQKWLKKDLIIGEKCYYRGQNDYSFDLIPSFLRNLEINNGDVVTLDTVKKKYDEYGFLEKYKTLFPQSTEDYEMVSYIQHCASYSPLLDVTNSSEIATIFACSGYGMNPNDYSRNDAAVFIFVDWDNKKEDITKLDLQIYTKKLHFNSPITNIHKETKPLYECSINDFEISYSFLDKNTNDRMKYQQGAFLFINKAIIVKNHILIPCNQLSIIKLLIPRFKKKEIYCNLTKKLKLYDFNNLMNPYQYIADFYK